MSEEVHTLCSIEEGVTAISCLVEYNQPILECRYLLRSSVIAVCGQDGRILENAKECGHLRCCNHCFEKQHQPRVQETVKNRGCDFDAQLGGAWLDKADGQTPRPAGQGIIRFRVPLKSSRTGNYVIVYLQHCGVPEKAEAGNQQA